MRLRIATIVLGAASLVAACNALLGIDPPDRVDAGADSGLPAEAGDGAPPPPDASRDAADACSPGLSSDPHNCGRCGHDCLGGDCDAGVCQPVMLASIQAPVGLAVTDGGAVYFSSEGASTGQVLACQAGQCQDGTQAFAQMQFNPGNVAVDDTNVYWTVQSNLTNEAGAVLGSIVTCGLLGCGAVGTAAVTPLVPQPVDFVLDPFNAYWTTGYGQVQKCPLPTCDGGPVTIDDEGIMHANGVAVGVASLYWTLPTKGDVMTCAVSGCVPEVFASGLDSPSKVIVVGSNVYWSDNSAEAGAIMTCPTSGCPDGGPSPFVSGQPGAFAVAADGTNLYFTRLESNGSVLACPLSGCPKPTVLASGQNSAKVVVQDAVSVYWLTSNALMRVAKP